MTNGQTRLIIPRHHPINALTMGSLAKDAGLTPEQFRALLQAATVPEPGTLGLLVAGALGVMGVPPPQLRSGKAGGFFPRCAADRLDRLAAEGAALIDGAADEVRSQIRPVNRKYPLAVLLEACAYYTQRKKQWLTFEYILIAGVNDRPEDAAALVRVARKVQAKINCIPYNQVEGLDWQRPSNARQDAFMAVLAAARIPATLRREKGHDIAAACGQLRRQTLPASTA